MYPYGRCIMRAVYTNSPMNIPRRRRDPALKTLMVMITVIALMFGIKFIYDPKGDLEDLAVMLESYETEELSEDQMNGE